MKTNLKRRLCLIISLVFLLSAVSFSAAANQTTVSLIHSEGWLETAYVTWNEYSGADGTMFTANKPEGNILSWMMNWLEHIRDISGRTLWDCLRVNIF